ncbi:hypothetical protein K488DRAFT_89545 [Vararia minispora EC-137]|uniref:Uncharacterized protein n=1 Tax=Vararia minispora EC-137 TaxID=1314806 RepID=A0ACB8QAH4_9AGAM|nr:hypothetical protein K488DRAFT_89545 [Vararia minispora EC-137]
MPPRTKKTVAPQPTASSSVAPTNSPAAAAVPTPPRRALPRFKKKTAGPEAPSSPSVAAPAPAPAPAPLASPSRAPPPNSSPAARPPSSSEKQTLLSHATEGWDSVYPFEWATLWPENGMLIGQNITYLPGPPVPPEQVAYICKDGFWGEREYTIEPQPFDHLAPHLAFFPAPREQDDFAHLLFRTPREHDLAHKPRKGTVLVLSEDQRRELERVMSDLRGYVASAQTSIASVFGASEEWENRGRRAKLFRGFKFPNAVFSNATDAFKMLADSGVPSRSQFQLYWHAMQRGMREMMAVVDFCATLLPCPSSRGTLQAVCTWEYDRRRCILSDQDAEDYYILLAQCNVPVYVLLWREQYPLADNDYRLQEAHIPVCDVEPDFALSTVQVGSVQPYCLPPQNVGWHFFEITARGLLPREASVPSDTSSSVPAKKKQKTGKNKGKGKDSTLSKGLSSKDRYYQGFTSTNPAFIRHLSTVCATRPLYMKQPLDKYEQAQQRAFTHLNMLGEVRGHISSFVPPVHLFYGCNSVARLHQYVALTIKLLPYLLHRVRLACTDPGVKGLTGKQWRDILGGEYWKEQWPGEEHQFFNMEGDFWKYGGASVFGREESEHIRTGATVPSMGRLLCGCEATREIIQGDGPLIASVVGGLNQWVLLYQLAALAQNSLATENIPVVQEGPIQYRTPDFFETDKARTGIIQIIKEIVIGKREIPTSGWLPLWTGADECDVRTRRRWLNAVCRFFIFHNDHCARIDELDSYGWTTSKELRWVQIDSLQDSSLDKQQQVYFNRFFISCFLAGQWPTEFLPTPDHPEDAIKCRTCRMPVLRLSEGQSLLDAFDLSDEDE